MSRFNNQVVVVIGAATGLGRSMAAGFAREGASVVVADVDAKRLDSTLELCRSLGADALAVQTDVMQKAALDNLAAKTLERFGRVNIVCSNAGVSEYFMPAWEKPVADWEWVMGVNLYGLVHAVNAFIPIMIQQKSGHFVCTASNSSLLSIGGKAAYVASKKAALGVCEVLQYDLQKANSPVKVSIICPNMMNTEMPDSARNRPAGLAGIRATADEVARLHTFLADGGHTPDEAAAIVLDGIAEQRFYIFTNPIDGVHTVEWAAGVQAGQLIEMKFKPPKLDKH